MYSRCGVAVAAALLLSVLASDAMAEQIIVQTRRQPTVSADVAVGGESVVLGAAAPVIVHSVAKPVATPDKKDESDEKSESGDKVAAPSTLTATTPATTTPAATTTPTTSPAPATSTVVTPASTTPAAKVAPPAEPAVADSEDQTSDEGDNDEETPLDKKEEEPKGYAARNGMYFELTGLVNYAGFDKCEKPEEVKEWLCSTTKKKGIGGGAALGFGYVIKNWVGLGVTLGGEYLKVPDKKIDNKDVKFVTLDATFMLELFPFAGLSVGAGAGYAASVLYNGEINTKLFGGNTDEIGYLGWVPGGLMFRGSVGYEFMVTDSMSIGLKFLYTRYDVSNLRHEKDDDKKGGSNKAGLLERPYEQEFGGLLMFRWY